MKAATIIGVVLIVLGIIALVYKGIPTKSERDVVRVGPMETTVETRKRRTRSRFSLVSPTNVCAAGQGSVAWCWPSFPARHAQTADTGHSGRFGGQLPRT